MNLLSRLFASAMPLALAACAAAGSALPSPQIPASAQAPFVQSHAIGVVQFPARDDWWRLYNDPVLDGLVQQSLVANRDLAVAIANLDIARAALRGTRSERLPQTQINGGSQYGRAAGLDRTGGGQHSNWAFSTGLAVSYEVDLFGRVRNDIRAAHADVDAAEADRDAVQVAVVAETTRAYAAIISSQRQLAVARHTVDLLDQSVVLAERRFRAGRTGRLDVVRIAALRDQQRALIPQFQADIEAATFRLATLTGRTPAERPVIRTDAKLLQLAEPIPVGDGRALLARRPDVRAAERRVAAAGARVGVATADLYPRITLGGALATSASGIASLFSGGAIGVILGPLLNWSFPNQQAARARVAGAEAQGHADLARFDKAVLTALEETETALSRYAAEIEKRQALQSARDQAEQAARITRAQLREGRADSLAVLDAERTLAEAEADLAASDARLADAQVDLFRALGGGWQNGRAPVASTARSEPSPVVTSAS